MPGAEQERLQLQELLRAAAEQKDGAATPREVVELRARQGLIQENSEVQRLRLEVAQLRTRVDALENPKPDPYHGFVDLMSEKG